MVAALPPDVNVVAAVEEPWLDVDVPAVASPPEDALLVTAACSSAASCRGTPENRGEVSVGMGLGVAARYLFRHRQERCSLTEGEPRRRLVLENEVSVEIDIVILIGDMLGVISYTSRGVQAKSQPRVPESVSEQHVTAGVAGALSVAGCRIDIGIIPFGDR